MGAESVNLYEYLDYRKYLSDFYIEQKKKHSWYSFRVFAKKAKLASPNYLKLVVDGKRRITEKNLFQFARGLGLKKKQLQYFRALVLYQESSEPEEKCAYFEDLLRLRKQNSLKSVEVKEHRYEILKKWHHWAIREMVLLKDFSPDPKWISTKLGNRITPQEAQESLALLERLKFIQNKEGQYILNEPLISTSDEVSSTLIRNLHRQFIELSIHSVLSDAVENREISGLTLALPKSKIPELKKILKEFRKELNHNFSKLDMNDEVYHLTLNLFPLTKMRPIS